MGGANFRQKNLLKDLIYMGQTRPINKQTIKGLFRFALEPLLEAQSQKAVVLMRLFETNELDGVLKRLEFTNAEVYSFDNITNGENLEKETIWGDTEFLVILSPRYSVVLLWDYSTETAGETSSVYHLFNSRDVNDIIKIISENSKIDLMRYTQEFTPERRSNDLLNKAVHKFIDFADAFVDEASLSQVEAGMLSENDDVVKKYEYISGKSKVISHDIKNHLSIIDLYSKIMEKRLESVNDKELQDSMSNALNSIKKSKDSIGSLLGELRSIQSADLHAHNFSKILESAINLVQARALETGTKFEVSNQFTGDILADENKFLNVLINLFYNAIDAVQAGKKDGVIGIKTEETKENMLRILVSDNGCGIETEKQEKIFEDGYTSKIAGSGLGLYISKETIKEQYGELSLVNSDKNGTTFEILLPKL